MVWLKNSFGFFVLCFGWTETYAHKKKHHHLLKLDTPPTDLAKLVSSSLSIAEHLKVCNVLSVQYKKYSSSLRPKKNPSKWWRIFSLLGKMAVARMCLCNSTRSSHQIFHLSSHVVWMESPRGEGEERTNTWFPKKWVSGKVHKSSVQ